MLSFLICLALLVASYFTYGRMVDNTFDYVVLPAWKLFLVQLLNIAGLGPIFGAMQGALWGPIVFLWITFGTIFAGAVHDYFSGMLSERNNGASISEVIGIYLGPVILGPVMKTIMRVFAVVLLIMVGTVFAVGPAGLIVKLLTEKGVSGPFAQTTVWLGIILLYYFIATFISIDKIIGKIYPVFGICLIVMIRHSRDLYPLWQHASAGNSRLELHVHHGRLRRDLRLPFDPVSPDGPLPQV